MEASAWLISDSAAEHGETSCDAVAKRDLTALRVRGPMARIEGVDWRAVAGDLPRRAELAERAGERLLERLVDPSLWQERQAGLHRRPNPEQRAKFAMRGTTVQEREHIQCRGEFLEQRLCNRYFRTREVSQRVCHPDPLAVQAGTVAVASTHPSRSLLIPLSER